MYLQQFKGETESEGKRGGKTILDLHTKEGEIYVSKKAEAFQEFSRDELKGYFVEDSELYYLDHDKEWVLLEGAMIDINGNRIAHTTGWVKISETNFNPEDSKFTEVILTKKIMDELESYNDALNENIKTHDKNVREDFNRKNPNKKVEHADDIPGDLGEDYDKPGNELREKRVAIDVAAKKKAAQVIVDYYEDYYNLESIFDANDFIKDEENDEVDRIFYDNVFPNDQATVQMGGYPKAKQDANDILNLGRNKWMATMEVAYKPENGDKLEIAQVILNLPIQELMNRFWTRDGDELGKSYKVISQKTGVLALMIAHEYIHAAQNTQKEHNKIANFPKAKNKKRRRAIREILAYHFTAFPNKKYDKPEDDPVFASTNFVRGETGKFKDPPELELALFVWKGLDYFRTYRSDSDPALEAKYKLLELEQDYLDAAESLKSGKYKIDIMYSTNVDQFLQYLFDKSEEYDADFENLVHEDPVSDKSDK